jgi:tetratricopeptide (TPR) repeat protein
VSELRLETYMMPAARLRADNPLPVLPALGGERRKGREQCLDESLTEEDRRYLGYGGVPGILPYGRQGDYGRALEPGGFRTAVLENEALRARFLLEMGGRLWSLVHKPTGRELLATNPGLQLVNFAVRGAWFSGGVEWNCGVRGHTPLTCAPLFAARLTGPGGAPVLRLYEWERIRGLPYQMDFYLPDGSPVLLARVRLVNPHPHEVPMYWWSNIAVPEGPDVRVVVPADQTLRHDYDGLLKRVPVPVFRDCDMTYATNLPAASDSFYCVESGQWPWIAALDRQGQGLVQASTARLRGRKLFAWGMGPGGRRWQTFLAAGGPPYIEIQAGLARTQSECLPLPAGAQWEWLEAYGLLEAEPAVVHGADWAAARREVEERLEHVVSREWLEAELVRTSAVARRQPDEVLHLGSGWGALELHRRAAAAEGPFCDAALAFDGASLGPAQESWLALLEEGAMPWQPPQQPPGAWMVQAEWVQMLESAVSAGRGLHWLSWYHFGVMRHHAGEAERARAAYEQSLRLAPSAWACRNLALLARDGDRPGEAADLWLEACRLAPDLVPLVVECAHGLMAAGRPGEAVRLLDSLAPATALHARVQVVRAQAALALGDLETVERVLLSSLEVSDLREGENVLTDLWFGLQERRIAAAEGLPITEELRRRVRRECPPPRAIDYRMSGGKD